MKNCIFLLFILFAFTANSQTIKNYSGKFGTGKATFEYFENEAAERVLHGAFTYDENGWHITGQYKNNLREGIWQATRTHKSVRSMVTANYKAGNLHGKCTAKNTDLQSNETILKNEAYFKNNLQVGEFSITSAPNDVEFRMKLDPNGFADSISVFKWRWGSEIHELIMDYKNGIELSEIYRKLKPEEFINETENKDFTNTDLERPFVRTTIDFPWADDSFVGHQILFWQTESINPLSAIKDGWNEVEFLPARIVK
jgi:hypothetical protein